MAAKCNPVKFEDFKMLECKSLIIYVLPVTNLTIPVNLFTPFLKTKVCVDNVIILSEFVWFLAFQKFILAMQLM